MGTPAALAAVCAITYDGSMRVRRLRPSWALPILLALLCPGSLAAQPARTQRPGPPPGTSSAATLEQLTDAVLGVVAEIPPQAATAAYLGTHREGSGIVIDADGRVVTIGYLVLEAEQVHLIRADGRQLPARVLGYDADSGLGLLQASAPLDVQPMALGDSARLAVGDPVLILTRGGIADAHTASVSSRRDFAAYWEYLLERAIFTTPPRRDYAGAALLDTELRLVGIGSLLVENAATESGSLPGNVFVPIDRLKPVLHDLVEAGRPRTRPRPWLGVSVAEQFGRVIVTRVVPGGPAQGAGLHAGDIILEVAGHKVGGLEEFYRQVWALGSAGVSVRLKLLQRADLVRIDVPSGDRYAHYHLAPRR
jgi:serine protease Do